MRIRIQVTAADDAKAWGILIRHSAGEAYPGRILVVSEQAVEVLRQAGIAFVELSREEGNARVPGVVASERV
jgi:hypothetical protein